MILSTIQGGMGRYTELKVQGVDLECLVVVAGIS